MTDDWRPARVEQVRRLIRAAAPDVVEEQKWKKPSNPDGVPTFSLDGLVGTVETFKGKVKVNFAKGAALPDPHGLFNASLESRVRRAIDLAEDDELDEDAFTELVKAAVEHNRS